MNKMKECVKCLQLQPIEQFGIRNGNLNGRCTICKTCLKVRYLLGVRFEIIFDAESAKKMGLQTKKCVKCKTEKPLQRFLKDATKKKGYRNVCKLCKTYPKHWDSAKKIDAKDFFGGLNEA